MPSIVKGIKGFVTDRAYEVMATKDVLSADKNGDGHHKCYGTSHPDRHLHLSGHTNERADADKIIQHEIVNQGCTDGNQKNVD